MCQCEYFIIGCPPVKRVQIKKRKKNGLLQPAYERGQKSNSYVLSRGAPIQLGNFLARLEEIHQNLIY